jgi:hypothetical protein
LNYKWFKLPVPNKIDLLVNKLSIQASIVRDLEMIVLTTRQVFVSGVDIILGLGDWLEQVIQILVDLDIVNAHNKPHQELLECDVTGAKEPLLHVVQVLDDLA